MANDTASDFDLGPLTWVQGEIDQALARGLEALAAFKAAPRDTTSLKHARAHVHQAAGAIQMVGLDAVTAYTDEIERHLVRMEETSPPEVENTCDLVDRACRKLRIFLDELVGGATPVPLKLFPEYELMSMVNEAAEGFDPLEFDRFTRFQELTRGIAEGVNDVSTVQQSLLKNIDEADAALLAQARLSRDVQQQLFSIRTVPFGSLSERLYRIMTLSHYDPAPSTLQHQLATEYAKHRKHEEE